MRHVLSYVAYGLSCTVMVKLVTSSFWKAEASVAFQIATGHRICRSRENARLTRAELATITGLSEHRLAAIEIGSADARLSELVAIGEALWIGPLQLIGGTDQGRACQCTCQDREAPNRLDPGGCRAAIDPGSCRAAMALLAEARECGVGMREVARLVRAYSLIRTEAGRASLLGVLFRLADQA